MAPPGSGIAETPQQVGRIDRAAVDISRQRREVFTRNQRNLIGDRGPEKIGFLVHRETRYSH
jgi:hypothetical protein